MSAESKALAAVGVVRDLATKLITDINRVSATTHALAVETLGTHGLLLVQKPATNMMIHATATVWRTMINHAFSAATEDDKLAVALLCVGHGFIENDTVGNIRLLKTQFRAITGRDAPIPREYDE